MIVREQHALGGRGEGNGLGCHRFSSYDALAHLGSRGRDRGGYT
jgi:hypothetical protein